jgi:DNA-binding transcriptional ArsR family regulator
VQISDPRAIRALAHPLRLELLKVLGARAAATAAECGRVLGASQASCSFHLRQLAKYGLVADAGPGSDRRERRWRLPDPRLTVRIADGSDAVVRRRIERLTVEQEMQAILGYSERPEGANPQWRHKAGMVAGMVPLSPDEAADVKEKWMALMAPYVARARAGTELQPGQQMVRCFMAITPVTAGDTTDGEDEQGD